MDQLKVILQTYLETQSIRATARRLQMSKNTVKDYIRRGQNYNRDLSTLLQLPEQELLNVFYLPDKEAERESPHRKDVFAARVDYWIKELRRVGVTRHLLWEEYREEHPEGYGYSQFCGHLKRAIGRKDLTLSMSHIPGSVNWRSA